MLGQYLSSLPSQRPGVLEIIDDSTGIATYTWDDIDLVVTMDNTTYTMTVESESEMIYGTFDVANGLFSVDMGYLCQTFTLENGVLTTTEMTDCMADDSWILEEIEAHIEGIMAGTSTISELTQGIYGAATYADETIDNADGSTTYNFYTGETITVDASGNVSGSADGFDGTFNSDGTFSINLYNDCINLSGDASGAVITSDIADCTPVVDFEELIMAALEGVDLTVAEPDITPLTDLLAEAV